VLIIPQLGRDVEVSALDHTAVNGLLLRITDKSRQLLKGLYVTAHNGSAYLLLVAINLRMQRRA
jgi:hypothetical protein